MISFQLNIYLDQVETRVSFMSNFIRENLLDF